jgi:hypothetical protein
MLTFSALEEFSKTHEHANAAFGAVGTMLAAFATVAAVVVSLCLARRSETVRLKVLLGIGLTTKAPSRTTVILQIENIGARVVSLSPQFFEWSIPFRRRHQPEMMATVVNTTYLIIPQPDLNHAFVSNIILTDMDDFLRHFANQLPLIGRKLKWFRNTRLRRLGASFIQMVVDTLK